MKDKFVPRLNLSANITETKLNTLDTPMRMNRIGITDEIPDFKDVFTDLVKNVDLSLKEPEKVMNDAMLGNGADIHDVMIAMSKAGLNVNIATQLTSKVIQAYEKVISIQL
ncbi:MAG TPA: flagellar hook-basal body complex protein FliE [Candidatus Gastranaerophilales bacterium]|nr:flagellar hook-basal body complex protein FliE [Candidatus Gastranaerophilales bacterium]